jgi:hypothetical protein
MGDFEYSKTLGEGQKGLKGFEEAEELAMGEEDWDQEGRSEGYDTPQDEADAIICQEVGLFGEEGLGALRLWPAGDLALHLHMSTAVRGVSLICEDRKTPSPSI